MVEKGLEAKRPLLFSEGSYIRYCVTEVSCFGLTESKFRKQPYCIRIGCTLASCKKLRYPIQLHSPSSVGLLSVELTGEGLSLDHTLFDVLKLPRLHMAIVVPNLELDLTGSFSCATKVGDDLLCQNPPGHLPLKERLHAHRNPDFLSSPVLCLSVAPPMCNK